MDKKIFAKRLKEQRETHGITQKCLASILGITERGYQYYESLSEFREPSFTLLLKITDELDISIDFLFSRTENPNVNI